MQQIIDAIKGAGKIPVLAKVLYQSNPSVDAAIQQYNLVINELVTQNNLTCDASGFLQLLQDESQPAG